MDSKNLIFEEINNYDQSSTPLWEYTIYRNLENIVRKNNISIDEKINAELLAFAFFESDKNDQSHWRTYYIPQISKIAENQEVVYEYPSLNSINPQMIDYWKERGFKSRHPILVSRYFGLVWDLSSKIGYYKPDHEIGKLYLKALINTIENNLYQEKTYAKIKISRAIQLALSLNDKVLIDRTKKAIISFDHNNLDHGKSGQWGIAYDLLCSGHKKLLTNSELQEIVNTLEHRLSELIQEDPWSSKAAASRLADYYNRNKNQEDLKRVLLSLADSYLHFSKKSSPAQSANYIEELYKIFSKFNLNNEAKEILIKLREAQKKSQDEFKAISTTVDIPTNGIEKLVNSVLSGNTSEVFEKIIISNIPIKNNVKTSLLKISKDHPLMYMISRSIVDRSGRVISKIGSIDQDFEGQMALHFSETIKFNSIGLHYTILEATKRKIFTKNNIISFLKNSCIITEERYFFLELGINYFFNKEFISSVHLIVPQIEEAIRNLLEMNGGNILVFKNGSYQLKTFDHILNDPIVIDVLTEDVCLYYKIIFTDSRGWNLRNNLAHGLLNPNDIDEQVNEQVLHALLILGLVRLANKN
jgi:hypothetical protein